jgi:hypothetical protein
MGIDENHNTRVQGEGDRIAALCESIRRAFPSDTYTRRVTPYDDELPSELREDQLILDEDQDLFRALKGRKWTEVSKQFIESLPDALPLLTDEAFVAFLPAWLVCSLENIDGENEVRDFVVYNFSPRSEMVPDTTWFTKNRLQLLNPEQRRIVRSLLMEFTERGTSPPVKALAAKGVSLIDTLA